MNHPSLQQFRKLCRQKGLPFTPQRQAIYATLMAMHGHPSPEEVYLRVRRKLPSISLATVYKNIHTFVESGVLREASLHHGPLRLEVNESPHHHLVCTRCKSITDIGESEFAPLRLKKRPRGFHTERFAVEVLGVCAKCTKAGNRI